MEKQSLQAFFPVFACGAMPRNRAQGIKRSANQRNALVPKYTAPEPGPLAPPQAVPRASEVAATFSVPFWSVKKERIPGARTSREAQM